MKTKLVTVAKVPYKRTTSQLLVETMTSLLDRVRVRAYELFEERGGSHGRELDDWLQAEMEVGMLPGSEVNETDHEIRLRVKCPKCGPGELKVYVEPSALTVAGMASETGRLGAVSAGETKARPIFRRYELPAAINAGSVRATVQNGVLKIVARKAVSSEERPKDQLTSTTMAAAAGSGLSGGLDLTLDPRKAFIPGPHVK